MFCHKSPVSDLAIDREGKFMATTGFDSLLKVRTLLNINFLAHLMFLKSNAAIIIVAF